MTTARLRSVLACLLLVSTAACGDDDGPGDDDDDGGMLDITLMEGCHPLAVASCAYPYPNMALTAEDDTTDTGVRLALTPNSLGFSTEDRGDREAFATWLNRADGFSRGTPILAQLGSQQIDRDTLPQQDEIATSIDPESSIQLFDMTSGDRLPMWAEVDLRASGPERQSVMIRQQVGLAAGHEILVAITNRVKDEDGEPIAPSDAFRALRDDITTNAAPLEALREEYDRIFTFLDDHDVERSSLVLAWRFVTFSDEFGTQQLMPVVERAYDEVEANPDDYFELTRTSCLTSQEAEAEELDCEYDADLHETVWRRLEGTFTVPNFLDEDGFLTSDEPIAEGGTPDLHGTLQAEILVHVPTSLRDNLPDGGAPILVFGHGLLANPSDYLASDVDSEGVMRVADELGAIAVATRWIGLSDDDATRAAMALGNFQDEQRLAERLVQAMVNTVLLVPFVRATLADRPELADAEGESLVNTNRVYYYGISLGGIFGTTFMAVNRDVTTGVLHVPTSMFATVLQHSPQFNRFQILLQGVYEDGIDQQLFLAYLQRLFDALEPINFAEHLAGDDTLTPLGTKNCLFQVNWGDKDAPDINEYALARTIGLPQAAPVAHDLYGINELATPSVPGTSALVVFDPQLGVGVYENDKGNEGPAAHGATRRNPEVRDQIVDYYGGREGNAEGSVVMHCGDEPCVIDSVPSP